MLYEPSEANAAFCTKLETSVKHELREEKNKAPVTSPSFGSSAHLRPQVLTDGGDVKRTNQNTIHCSKIVNFLAARNTDNNMKHTK